MATGIHLNLLFFQLKNCIANLNGLKITLVFSIRKELSEIAQKNERQKNQTVCIQFDLIRTFSLIIVEYRFLFRCEFFNRSG